MVYEKARSGDPDYDDKQPPEFHSGGVVTAGDGVFFSEVAGFHDANGAHVNPDAEDDEGDQRPSPGNVASVSSTTQTYAAEDTPTQTYAEYEDGKAEAEKGQADESKSPSATSTAPRTPAAKKTTSTTN